MFVGRMVGHWGPTKRVEDASYELWVHLEVEETETWWINAAATGIKDPDCISICRSCPRYKDGRSC